MPVAGDSDLAVLELPNDEDLDFFPEIKLSSGAMKAGARYMSFQCEKPMKEFLLCSKEERDPRICLEDNRKYQWCAMDAYHQMVTKCQSTFNKLTTCIEWEWRGRQWVRECRKEFQNFEICVQNEIGWKKPLLRETFQPTILANVQRPKPSAIIPPGLDQDILPSKPDFTLHPDAKGIVRRPFGMYHGMTTFKSHNPDHPPTKEELDPFSFRSDCENKTK